MTKVRNSYQELLDNLLRAKKNERLAAERAEKIEKNEANLRQAHAKAIKEKDLEIQEANTLLKQAEKTNKNHVTDLETSRKMLSQKCQELTDSNIALKNCQADLNKEKTKRQRTKDLNATLVTQIERQTAELTTTCKKVATLAASYAESNNSRNKSAEENANQTIAKPVQEEINKLKSKTDTLEKRNTELQSLLTAKYNELKKYEGTNSPKTDELQAKLKASENSNTTLRDIINNKDVGIINFEKS